MSIQTIEFGEDEADYIERRYRQFRALIDQKGIQEIACFIEPEIKHNRGLLFEGLCDTVFSEAARTVAQNEFSTRTQYEDMDALVDALKEAIPRETKDNVVELFPNKPRSNVMDTTTTRPGEIRAAFEQLSNAEKENVKTHLMRNTLSRLIEGPDLSASDVQSIDDCYDSVLNFTIQKLVESELAMGLTPRGELAQALIGAHAVLARIEDRTGEILDTVGMVALAQSWRTPHDPSAPHAPSRPDNGIERVHQAAIALAIREVTERNRTPDDELVAALTRIDQGPQRGIG